MKVIIDRMNNHSAWNSWRVTPSSGKKEAIKPDQQIALKPWEYKAWLK